MELVSTVMMNVVRWVAGVVVVCVIVFGVAFVALERTLGPGPNVTGPPASPAVQTVDAQAVPETTAAAGTQSLLSDDASPALSVAPTSNDATDSIAKVAESQAPVPAPVNIVVDETLVTPLSTDIDVPEAVSAPTEQDDSVETDLPIGDEELTGRVLSSTGEVLSDVTVALRRRDAVTRQIAKAARRAKTDDKGVYRFISLAPGDYQLKNEPIAGFADRTTFVRAGSGSADLVLEPLRRISVRGQVTDEAGVGLGGVEIFISGTTTAIVSEVDGTYTAEASLHRNLAIALRYERNGYASQTRMINGREINESTEKVLDVVMPASGELSISGRLVDELGQPVAGETVRLFSPSMQRSHNAVSDEGGEFTIVGLGEGQDYRVSVIPQRGYRRYERGPLTVNAGTLPLEVVLETESTGEVTGSISTVSGQPLPGFSMSMISSRSPARSIAIVADETGRFAVTDVPDGNLYFSTTSQPRIEARGLTLLQGSQLQVDIIADIGPWSHEGIVLDGQGQPVSGADITLTGRINRDALIVTSYRRTSTDSSGRYRLTEIGAGPHRVTARHEIEGQVQQEVRIGAGTTPAELTLIRDGG